MDGLTRDVAGEIASEEGSYVSYILRRTATTEGDLSFPLLTYVFGERTCHIGDDEAWCDRIGTYATSTEFLSDTLR